MNGKKTEGYLQNVSGILKSREGIELVSDLYMCRLEIRLNESFVHRVYLYEWKPKGYLNGNLEAAKINTKIF